MSVKPYLAWVWNEDSKAVHLRLVVSTSTRRVRPYVTESGSAYEHSRALSMGHPDPDIDGALGSVYRRVPTPLETYAASTPLDPKAIEEAARSLASCGPGEPCRSVLSRILDMIRRARK